MSRSPAIMLSAVMPDAGRARWLAPAVVGLVTFAVFVRTLSCDFVFDDWLLLVNNAHLNPPTWAAFGYYWTHVTFNLYQPITSMVWELAAHLAYLADADVNGNHLNPAVFHLIGISIHAAAAVALWRVLMKLTGHAWAAVAGTLVFAIHPLQVEAVTFIGALNNPLLGIFSFLALGDYLAALEERQPWRKFIYYRGMVFLVLAMLSKPTAIVIPPIALLLDLATRKQPRAAVLAILPYCALILPCLIWTRLLQSGGAAGNGIPVLFRPVIAADAIVFYVMKTLLPWRFCTDYGLTPIYLYAHSWVAIAGLATVALLLLAAMLYRRFPLVATAIFAFVVAILPTSGLLPFDFQQYSTVADRYGYLAMFGPALLVTLGLSRVRTRHQLAAGVICVMVFLALAVDTFNQIGYWRDDRTLFAHTVEVNPTSPLGYMNLASGLLRTDPSGARKAAEKAAQLRPEMAGPLLMIAAADFSQGDRDSGIRELRKAIALNSGELAAHKALAAALNEKGDSSAALQEYRRCLELDPSDAAVHSDLAALLAETGRLPEAIEEYHRALAINSRLEPALQGLAMAEQRAHQRPMPSPSN